MNQDHAFKLCRFHFDLVYTTRQAVSSCYGPRPTVVLSTRYKLEDDNETSNVYSEWAPMQVYSAGIKLSCTCIAMKMNNYFDLKIHRHRL